MATNDPASGASKRTRSSPAQSQLQGLEPRMLNIRGRQLVIRLTLLLRTAHIHDVRNEALQRSIDFLLQSANTLLTMVSPVVLQGDQDQVYINDFRIRGDTTVYSNVKMLVAELKQRGTGGITFHSELRRDDVLRLLDVMLERRPVDLENGYAGLNDALAQRGVSCISFNPYLELGASGGELRRIAVRSRPTLALKTYSKVLVAMKRVAQQGMDLKPIDRLKLTRNVQALVDLCYDDELFFSGLTSLKCDGDYSYFHPVHVAMLSIQMGKHIGFGKKQLMDLALAALYYDVGRARLGPVQLEKPQTLTAEEWDAVRRHPLRSAREILRGSTLSESVRRRLVVAFEHHRWLQEGGYPQRIQNRQPHLFSRIVAIADAYDALTTTRPHRDGFLPAEALRLMLDDSGKRYDPTLMKVLVNILQIYPQGTLVLLDTREVATVYQNHSDNEFRSRPIVQLLTDANGQRITPRVFDLLEKSPDGQFLRSIRRTLDPDESGAYLMDRPS